MGNKSAKMIGEVDLDDILFIGGREKLMQWSVSRGEVIKDYDDIMADEIYLMVQTSDKKYLFVSDMSGCLKQINVKTQEVVRDYGKIHRGIHSIAITSDDKFFFTSGKEDNGHVKKFSVRNGQMIEDYGAVFENDRVESMITTPDNKWLFAASTRGHLKQIPLESQGEVHDYGKIHD
jgi:WD40 repeat protein